MQVPSMEEFVALQKRVDMLSQVISQMQSEKINVERVSMEVACQIVRCSRTTVWRLIKNGELATSGNGKKVWITLDSIRAYLKTKGYTPISVETRIKSLYAA